MRPKFCTEGERPESKSARYERAFHSSPPGFPFPRQGAPRSDIRLYREPAGVRLQYNPAFPLCTWRGRRYTRCSSWIPKTYCWLIAERERGWDRHLVLMVFERRSVAAASGRGPKAENVDLRPTAAVPAAARAKTSLTRCPRVFTLRTRAFREVWKRG